MPSTTKATRKSANPEILIGHRARDFLVHNRRSQTRLSGWISASVNKISRIFLDRFKSGERVRLRARFKAARLLLLLLLFRLELLDRESGRLSGRVKWFHSADGWICSCIEYGALKCNGYDLGVSDLTNKDNVICLLVETHMHADAPIELQQ